jgi:hypothetical protein
MRFEFSALPWEILGTRPAMITLTYPGDWALYVPHAREFARHREALKERWRKKWGPPIGVWIAEFQGRGAPHLHLYLGLPDGVRDEDYMELQSRTMRRKRREYDLGAYEARRRTPPVSGEFGEWLRTVWWEIVGSGLPAHHKRGVDIAVAFFSDQAESETDRVKVAEYFWRESGKWAQKQPPDGFGSLKFYGRWGGKLGFNPVVTREVLDEMVGLELRRMMRRLMLAKMRQEAKRTRRRVRRGAGKSRGFDGLKVFGVNGIEIGPRMRECAEQLAIDKASRVGVTRPMTLGRGPVWRAASEREVETEPDERIAAWEDGPPDAVERGDWDDEMEAEAYWERREEEEAAILDAIDAEAERLRRMNAVRVANGVAPRPQPKRLRIVRPKLAGRERKAR